MALTGGMKAFRKRPRYRANFTRVRTRARDSLGFCVARAAPSQMTSCGNRRLFGGVGALINDAMPILFLIVFVDLVGFGLIIPLLPFYAERFRSEERRVGKECRSR